MKKPKWIIEHFFKKQDSYYGEGDVFIIFSEEENIENGRKYI